jgi:hypothetical protein
MPRDAPVTIAVRPVNFKSMRELPRFYFLPIGMEVYYERRVATVVRPVYVYSNHETV